RSRICHVCSTAEVVAGLGEEIAGGVVELCPLGRCQLECGGTSLRGRRGFDVWVHSGARVMRGTSGGFSGLRAGGLVVGVMLVAWMSREAAQDAKEKGEGEPKVAADGKLVPLVKTGAVVLDPKAKKVLLKTKVVLREGVLEMLVCKKQTKEHEAIL